MTVRRRAHVMLGVWLGTAFIGTWFLGVPYFAGICAGWLGSVVSLYTILEPGSTSTHDNSSE